MFRKTSMMMVVIYFGTCGSTPQAYHAIREGLEKETKLNHFDLRALNTSRLFFYDRAGTLLNIIQDASGSYRIIHELPALPTASSQSRIESALVAEAPSESFGPL